jgi:hypothetical protein
MVRMEVADAAVNEIMATTFRVRVKRLILVKGTDYQDQLDEISYRIRALDPDVMSDEQFDEQVRRLRAERDRLKALPAEPDRWDEQLTAELYADIYQALPVSERGAWLTSHGFVIHATKKQVSVIQGDVRDSSPRVTVVCSGMKAQPFQVAVNTSPQDGQPWLLVSWPGIHVPSNRLPQPGQSSGECSVILIPGRSSPLPASRRDRRGSGCRNPGYFPAGVVWAFAEGTTRLVPARSCQPGSRATVATPGH